MQFFRIFILTIFVSPIGHGQSHFYKRYFVPEAIYFQNVSDLSLRNESTEKQNPLSTSVRLYKGKIDQSSNLFVKNKSPHNFSNKEFVIRNKANGKTKYIKANVKLENKFLYVNPWLNDDLSNQDDDYAFELSNRQEIKLSYEQITLSPITMPIKIQFGHSNNTSFSAGIELGGLIGYTWGQTRFTYRRNLDNFQRSHEFTLGGVFSFQGIEFERKDETVNKTIATSIGIATVYAYDNICLGFASGIEFAHGYGAQQWNYHNRPWIGLIIGYSLFE